MKPLGAAASLDREDSINQDQLAFWLINEGVGSVTANIQNRNVANATILAGAVWGPRSVGRALYLDGGATSYLDLGTARFLPSTTTPFTFAWIESPASAAPAFMAVACFMAIGATERWLLMRDDSTAGYRYLCCGLGSSNARVWAGAPSLVTTISQEVLYVLTGSGGVGSSTNADYNLYSRRLDGGITDYGNSTTGGALSSQTANLNYLGWDGADAKFKGHFEMARLWRRVISASELSRLYANPFAGLTKPSLLAKYLSGDSAMARRRMFINV